MTLKGSIWYLSISSFEGVVYGASHYVPVLYGPRKKVDVAWCISAEEAAELNRVARNKGEDLDWFREGMRWTHFATESDAIRAGVIVWNRLVDPERDILILGQKGETGKVLAGPQEHVESLTALFRKIEAIPDCGHGSRYDRELDRQMTAVVKEYSAYEAEHFEPRIWQTTYGRGAKNDPNREVESEEVAWGVEIEEEEPDTSIPLVVPPGFEVKGI